MKLYTTKIVAAGILEKILEMAYSKGEKYSDARLL
jgi:hypothetical protein